jgi:hypothetical protein
MTEQGACIRCHRDAEWVCYHRKDAKSVVARLCNIHRAFAPRRTTMEKLPPRPVDPDAVEDRPAPDEIVRQDIEHRIEELQTERISHDVLHQRPRPSMGHDRQPG